MAQILISNAWLIVAFIVLLVAVWSEDWSFWGD